jgi:hypothetical protein
MARIRSIKPEWLEDERLLGAGSDARVISIALIVLADDHGRGRGNARWLATQIFPMEPDGLANFREGVEKLLGWFVNFYEVRGQTYYELPNWLKHQKVDKPGKPRVPPPEKVIEALAKAPATLATDLDLEEEEEREGKARARAQPSPTLRVAADPPPRDAATLVRLGYTGRYADKLGHTPSPKSLTRDVPPVAEWVRENAPLRGITETELVDELLDGLFARDDLDTKRWPLAFIGQDPLEFLGHGPARARPVGRPAPTNDLNYLAEQDAADAAAFAAKRAKTDADPEAA